LPKKPTQLSPNEGTEKRGPTKPRDGAENRDRGVFWPSALTLKKEKKTIDIGDL